MFVRSSCLTDMCLNVIVNNLEVIVFNKNIPQKNVDFLLRAYSRRVYDEYRLINGTVKEDIMLWFLSPHVKEITLPRKLFSEKIVDKLKLTGMGITSLNLKESHAPENVLNAIIRCVPCVKILDLTRTSCTDSTLSIIQETCTDLESLTLRECLDITIDGLENLCRQYESLNILEVIYSRRGLYRANINLNRIPSPESDKFVGYPEKRMKVKDEHLKYNITELRFCNLEEVDSESIQTLARMFPKIKSLEFYYILLKKKILEACTVFKELEELKLTSHIRFSLAPILPVSLNLKTLILSTIEIPTVMLIENFKNLRKLCLKDVTFTSFKKEDIKCKENKLNSLVIEKTDMEVFSSTYQAITLLISLSRNVTELDLLCNRNLSSDLFDVILNSMKHLTSVSLYFIYIESIVFLLPFFDVPSVKTMYTNFSYDTIENFAKQKLSKSISTLSWRYINDVDSDEDFDSVTSEDSDLDFDEDSSEDFDEDSDEDFDEDSDDYFDEDSYEDFDEDSDEDSLTMSWNSDEDSLMMSEDSLKSSEDSDDDDLDYDLSLLF